MKSCLKLALVTRRYPPLIGGAERIFSYLAAALAAQGTDVTVLTSNAPGCDTFTDIRSRDAMSASAPSVDALAGQLRVIRLPTSSLRFWGTWIYMRHLVRWLRQNTIDLAYVSMLKHDAYAVLGAKARRSFPVVLRPEGAGATGDVAWQSRGNFGRIIGHRCRKADAFVAVSGPIDLELRAAWKSGTMRLCAIDRLMDRRLREPWVTMIPNGVPVPPVPWMRLATSMHQPRAVFIGRLAAEKGLDTLVDAWPLVRAAFPGAQLILAGEGTARAALEAQSRRHSLRVGPDGAISLPGVSLNPMELLRGADLFVLPSREEGMSIALLEAMALGIPIVASSIPGNAFLIRDGEHGRLAPPNDPYRLAQVIIEQWLAPVSADQMGQAARRRVQAEFSIEGVAHKHLKLFHQILEQRD
jgi:glycosyltransferase involved in cell wall biosynthesis